MLLVKDSAVSVYLVQRVKEEKMGLVLFWLGVVWIVIGVINLNSEVWATGGQLFHFLVFLLPGLVAAGMGAKLYARSKPD